MGCDSLRELTISEDNPYYQSINGVIYSKDGKTIEPVPPAIPFDSVDFDGIIVIGDFAFCCRESEKEFVIPKQITSIGTYAFYGCCEEDYWANFDEETSINIQLNEGLTSIGDYAFSNIGYLREMGLPDSLLTLGKATFSSTSLESMTILSKVTVIPDSVEHIGESAFSGNGHMTSCKFPNSITKIEPYTFYDCELKSITISKALQKLVKEHFVGII